MIDFADRRLDDLGHFGHDRAFRDTVDRLLNDAQRLAHFSHADQIPVVGVAVSAGRNVEIKFGISCVGLGLRRSHLTPLARNTGPVTPRAMASAAEITPTFLVRSIQMRLVVSSSSYSSIFGATKVRKFFTSFSNPA